MNEDIKMALMRRTNIMKGQIEGVQKMIYSDAYCMDILTQSLAIQKSLASLNKVILKNHLETHVADMLASNNEDAQSKAIKELLGLYELNNIRGK